MWKNWCVELLLENTSVVGQTIGRGGRHLDRLVNCHIKWWGYSRYIVLWRQHFVATKITVCHNTRRLATAAVLYEVLYQLGGPNIKCVTPCITHKSELI